MKKTLRHIRLTPDYANLNVLESFIAGCDFFTPAEINRAMLISTEYFDNIVEHSRSLGNGDVHIVLAKNTETGHSSIRFRYSTRNFFQMIRGAHTARPHYDSSAGRYRGLGLRMCRNLASDIRYRQGLLKSSIIIIL